MDVLCDKVVLRKRRIEGDLEYYALLVDVHSGGPAKKNHWTDKAALKKVGFGIGRCTIYDSMINPKH